MGGHPLGKLFDFTQVGNSQHQSFTKWTDFPQVIFMWNKIRIFVVMYYEEPINPQSNYEPFYTQILIAM